MTWKATTRARLRGFGVVMTVGIAACYADYPTGAQVTDGLAVGVVGFYHADLPNISLPETATSGGSVMLVIDTWGNGCLELGPDKVRRSSMRVFVTPYDRVRSLDGPCDDILLRFRHEVLLTFEYPGRNRVTVLARERPNGPIEEFEREILVH